MNLDNALLCVQCEWLYADAPSCPRCGSRVSFPIARTMNRRRATIRGLVRRAREGDAGALVAVDGRSVAEARRGPRAVA